MTGASSEVPDFVGHAHRLEAYSGGYFARLYDALKGAYAKTQVMLGEEAFYHACASYVALHPSQEYNINEYGHDFAEVIEVPWIADLAKLEWLIQKSFHADDRDAVTNPFEAVSPENLLGAQIKFKRSCLLMTSTWPLVELWSLPSVPEEPIQKVDTILMTYRLEDQVYFRAISKPHQRLIEVLTVEKTLGEAFDEVENLTPESVTEFFQLCKSTQIVKQVLGH